MRLTTEERELLYDRLIAEGKSPAFAAMLADQAPPGVKTDSTFFGNAVNTVSKIMNDDPEYGQAIVAQARRHGYNPNPNDVYESGLAEKPGDPLAFVPATGGRGHIRKVLESRGWGGEGAVNIKARQPERDPLEGTGKPTEPVGPGNKAKRRELAMASARKVATAKQIKA